MKEQDKRRNPPSVWVKSLAKLLGGDDRCWYRAWYQTNHYTKREEPTPEDRKRLDGYQRAHDAITAVRAAELRAAGWLVRIEDDAAVRIKGETGELSGKPDLVALRDGEALVVDAKSGKRRDGDAWQVLVYMFALPLSWLGTGVLRGEIAYPDENVPVRALTAQDVATIGAGVRRLAFPTPPEMTPSKWECGYCPLADCPKRWDESAHAGETRLF